MKNRKRFLSIGLSMLVMLVAMPTLTVKAEENPVNPVNSVTPITPVETPIKMEKLKPAMPVVPKATTTSEAPKEDAVVKTEGVVSINGKNIIRKATNSVLSVETDINKFKTMEFTINYDTKQINVLSVAVPEQLKSFKPEVVIVRNENQDEVGQVNFKFNFSSDYVAASDIVKLFDMNVRSINGAAKTTLTFGEIKYTQAGEAKEGQKVPDVSKLAAGKSFDILGHAEGDKWDLNGDLKINILDVIRVTRAIGLDNTKAELWNKYKDRDLNADGKISHEDVELLKAHLGEQL